MEVEAKIGAEKDYKKLRGACEKERWWAKGKMSREEKVGLEIKLMRREGRGKEEKCFRYWWFPLDGCGQSAGLITSPSLSPHSTFHTCPHIFPVVYCMETTTQTTQQPHRFADSASLHFFLCQPLCVWMWVSLNKRLHMLILYLLA